MSTASNWPFLRIAHRGAAGLEPENTLRAMQRAIDLGVEMVEIDVRPCGDGTLMVIHDDTLDRVAGAPVRVSDLTVEQLQQFDLGKGECVPRLDEALDLLCGKVLVNLDQKADGIAPQLLQAIDHAGNRQDVMLSGNARATFAAFRELAPDVHIALSIDAHRRDWLQILSAKWLKDAARGQAATLVGMARAAGLGGVTLDYHLASRNVVHYCKQAGLHVLTWTVDDLPTMRALRDAGVDGITSNRPDLLMRL